MIMDPICPRCYIGYQRMKKAQALRPSLPLVLSWLPCLLNPGMPTRGMERQLYLDRKFGKHATELYEHIEEEAAAEGLSLSLEAITTTPNTVKAHQLIAEAQAQGKAEAFVLCLFQAYLERGLDIGRDEVLLALAQACGLAEAEETLSTNRHLKSIIQQDATFRQSGVKGIPCFLGNESHFLPRAQSPLSLAALIDLAYQETIGPDFTA